MRRRQRTREVPPALVDGGASWETPGEHRVLVARFAERPPGAGLAAAVAEAGGVDVADLAAVVPGGTRPEDADPPRLVAVLPHARQHAARQDWLRRNVPRAQQHDAFMAMIREELFA